jgi:hypothetical protein
LTREDIKARYKAGEITKDQAMMELESLRTGAPVASQDPREAIKAQYKSGAIDKPQAMQMLEQLRMAPQEEVGPVASFPPEPVADPAPIAQAPVEQPVPVAQGGIALPGHPVDGPPLAEQYSGLMKTIADMFSGESRKTKRSENLKGWQEIPELQEWAFSNIGPSFKTALGSMFSGDQKGILKTLQENYPDLEYDEDSKGNPIIKSNATGEWHSIKPGVRLGDVPAIAAQGLTIMGGPAKMMKHLPKMGRLKQMALAEGGSQAVIEGAKELGGAGGELGEVGLAAAMPVGTETLGRVTKGLKGAVSGVDEAAVQTAKAAAREVPVDTVDQERVGQIVKDAALGSRKARRELAEEIKVNQEAKAQAEAMGFDFLSPDVFSDSPKVRAAAGLGRSVVGSEAEAAWRTQVSNAVEQADKIMEESGARFFGEGPSTAAVSDKLMDSMKQTRDSLNKEAGKLYDEVDALVPKNTEVDLSNLDDLLTKTVDEVGEGGLSSQEKRMLKMLKGSGGAQPPTGALRVYHGSPNDIDGPIRGNVKWTTPSREHASEYGEVNDFYVSIENPFNVRTAKTLMSEKDMAVSMMNSAKDAVKKMTPENKNLLRKSISSLSSEKKMAYEIWDESESVVSIAKKLGFDGIKSTDDGHEILGAFDDAQIFRYGDAPLNQEPITYGRLLREKSLIGKAIGGQKSPYDDMDSATLKKIYSALAKDQLAVVGEISEEGLEKLNAANLLYAKKSDIQDDIISAFGKDGQGSLGKKLENMIVGASKQDATQFNRIMAMVPKDLRKEAITTALAGATRSRRGAEKGGFGFSEFSDVYAGLKKNPSVYSEISKELGPDAMKTYDGLYDISKRITDARANVLQTGKANQAMESVIESEGLLSGILRIGERMADWAPGVGNIPRDGIGWAADLTSKGGSKAVKATGDLFESKEFKQAVEDHIKRADAEKTAKRLSFSKPFRNFAKAANLPLKPSELERWILASMRTQQNLSETEDGNANQ